MMVVIRLKSWWLYQNDMIRKYEDDIKIMIVKLRQNRYYDDNSIKIMIKNVESKWYMMMYDDGIEMIMILK